MDLLRREHQKRRPGAETKPAEEALCLNLLASLRSIRNIDAYPDRFGQQRNPGLDYPQGHQGLCSGVPEDGKVVVMNSVTY
jgi:hypothetical protein